MDNHINNEKRLATMEAKIDNITKSVDGIAKDIKEHVKCETERYEKLDTKYSGKWVEKAIISIGTAIVIAIIIAFLKFM